MADMRGYTEFKAEGACCICWGSHMCTLPERHEGDHACLNRDDEENPGEPHDTCPRTGPVGYGETYLYMLSLIQPDNDWCEICGPLEPPGWDLGWLDHGRAVHPEIWAQDYADCYQGYLGRGEWAPQ